MEKVLPKVGQWILTEKYTFGRFGHPKEVTAVSGQRVYWRFPHRYRGVIEDYSTGYCALKSVLRVVDSEEIGITAYKEQQRLSAIMEAENAASLQTFRDGVNSFFKELK